MRHSVNHNPRSPNKVPLTRWLHQALGQAQVQIRYRIQGNHFHLLCEANPCPDRQIILPKLLNALKAIDLNTLIPADQPQIYQLSLYGREQGQRAPTWQKIIHLNQIDRHLQELQEPIAVGTARSQTGQPRPSKTGSELVLSNRSLARRGEKDAIARFLSETLSALGVAVKVNVKTLPYVAPPASQTWTLSGFQPLIQTATPEPKRLWITCESDYSPEPSLIAEPIAQQIRDLELEGFHDAIVLIQVQGETQPDWVLQVDLTPAKELLREWARWGDVEALSYLLNEVLSDRQIQMDSATLKQSTLHITCRDRDSAPDRCTVKETALPLLERLAPQGIHSAVIYGQVDEQTEPAWVEWVDLPASVHPALAESPLTLAQQMDWAAMAFLLSRLLNVDLQDYLATGGVRIQLLPKQDLLHIMCDAPICPAQQPVGQAIARFLRQLNLPGIGGIRVYGRRAGQKRPTWSYGADFATRDRLVLEPVPEFAATDAYVGDLIARSQDSIFRPDFTAADLKTGWSRWRQRWVQRIQRSLVRSQLFTLTADAQAIVTSAPSANDQPLGLKALLANGSGAKAAMVWGTVGLLLTLQTNWMLTQVLNRSQEASIAPAQTSPLAPLAPSDAADPENRSSFIQIPSPSAANVQQDELLLGSSPVLPPADLSFSVRDSEIDLPTFNSQQLDQKLALYYALLEESGPPDVLILGSSRALRGVDPVAIKDGLAELGYKNVSVFNFGINGATAQVEALLMQQFLTPDQLPRLIIWADGTRAFNSGRVDVTYNGIAASEGYRQLSKGDRPLPNVETASAEPGATAPEIAVALGSSYQDLDRWLSDQLAKRLTLYTERDRLKSSLQEQITALMPQPASDLMPQVTLPVGEEVGVESLTGNPVSLQDRIDANGFLPLDIRFNPATYYQQYARVSGDFDRDYESFQIQGKQTEALETLLELTQSYDIPVVFVNLPLTDEYLDPSRRQHEQAFTQYMLGLALTHDHFVFRDLGDEWLSQYDYFSDPSHLNRYGAYAIANRLVQDPMIPWSIVERPPAAERN